jgi:hypothetical protein
MITALIEAMRVNYELYGTSFEFYDAKAETAPTVLERKGHRSGGVRDYHWTAALTLVAILEDVQ